LDEGPVIGEEIRLVVALRRIHPRQRQADLGLQEGVFQVSGMQTAEEDLAAHLAEAQQRPDIDHAKTRPRASLRRIQSPAVIGFRPRLMDQGIAALVVGLLVESQAVDSGLL